MRRETPKIRLDLLLYINMGAEALANYLKTTKVEETWYIYINDKPGNATNATGWGTLDQHQDEHHDGSSGETGGEAEEENGGEEWANSRGRTQAHAQDHEYRYRMQNQRRCP